MASLYRLSMCVPVVMVERLVPSFASQIRIESQTPTRPERVGQRHLHSTHVPISLSSWSLGHGGDLLVQLGSKVAGRVGHRDL